MGFIIFILIVAFVLYKNPELRKKLSDALSENTHTAKKVKTKNRTFYISLIFCIFASRV